jgi:hypothetical protein
LHIRSGLLEAQTEENNTPIWVKMKKCGSKMLTSNSGRDSGGKSSVTVITVDLASHREVLGSASHTQQSQQADHCYCSHLRHLELLLNLSLSAFNKIEKANEEEKPMRCKCGRIRVIWRDSPSTVDSKRSHSALSLSVPNSIPLTLISIPIYSQLSWFIGVCKISAERFI